MPAPAIGDEQQCLHLSALQVLDRRTRRRGAVDHDGTERVAERGGDRDFGALRDLDVVDERTEHAVEVRDRVATGRGVGRVECERERLGSRPPARRLGFRRAQHRVAGTYRFLGGLQVGGERREVGNLDLDERGLFPTQTFELFAQLRSFGDQRLDDTFVGDRGELALESAPPLGHEVDETAAAFAQRLGAREHVGDVVVARDRSSACSASSTCGVERAQPHTRVLFLLREVAPRGRRALPRVSRS